MTLSSIPQGERLNKYVALRLGVSRREADDYIDKKRVHINGEPAILGARVQAGDNVTVDGKPLSNVDFIYIALNKPVGYLSSRRSQGDIPTLYKLLPSEYHTLKPVGRLDKDSSGLLLLTNDGDFAYQMTHPKFYKTKIYEVQLDHDLEPLHQQMISDYGVQLEDGASKFMVERMDDIQDKRVTPSGAAPAFEEISMGDFSKEGAELVAGPAPSDLRANSEGIRDDGSDNTPATYKITMHEGRNRQIRRTFAALGYTVTKLHRTQFGNYSLGDMNPGEYKTIHIS